MQPDPDFETLVRKSGILFTTNMGAGAEEVVLAIATPTLQKTQVATQADMVAAGYIRAEGLRKIEAERERLKEALASVEARAAQLHEEATQRTAANQQEVAALNARIAGLEQAKSAEQAGIVARNQGQLVTANPHDPEDMAAAPSHKAWGTGWKLRDVLLGLNERNRKLLDETQALQTANQSLQTALLGRATEIDELKSVITRLEREVAARRSLGEGHEHKAQAQAAAHAALEETHHQATARLTKLQTAYQHLLLEAPHGEGCARASSGCDCWLAKYGYTALVGGRA